MRPKNIARSILFFLGFIMILFIVGLFTRCTPFHRLQQLQKNAPELFTNKVDSTYKFITIAGSNLQGTGEVHTSTTFVSNTMSIVYFTKNNNWTIDGTCFPQVVTVTSYVTTTGINQKEFLKQSLKELFNELKWWIVFIGIAILVLSTLYLILKK